MVHTSGMGNPRASRGCFINERLMHLQLTLSAIERTDHLRLGKLIVSDANDWLIWFVASSVDGRRPGCTH